MGTTSEKLTYLNNTKQLLKEAINDLGGDIDNNTTFRNYVQKLNDIYAAYPKVTGTGKEVVLSGTKKARMEVTPKGESEQKSTNGYNLCNENDENITLGGDLGTVTLIDFGEDRTFTNITISLFLTNAKNTSGGNIVNLKTDNGTNNYRGLSNFGITTTGQTLNGKYSCTVSNITFRYLYLFTHNNIYVKWDSGTCDAMAEEGATAHDWEQYTGGIPAPNPDFPFPVVNVTGNNSVEVNSKNLFDKSAITADKGINVNTGVLYPSNTTFVTDYIPVKVGSYYANGLSNATVIYGCLFNKNKEYLSSIITTNDSSRNILNISNSQASYMVLTFLNEYLDELIIANGNQATTYVPYAHQTKPLNLGTLELCKIGNYQDYIYRANGKFYKHSEIEKVTLNGSETWQSYTSIDDNIAQIRLLKDFGSREAKSDKFIVKNDYSATEHLVIGGSLNAIFAHILKSRLSSQTASAFKIWLSNNNIKLYYVLVTPTETELTDTQLINQLNEIYKMNSYDDTTIITTTYSNAQADLLVSALKK